MSGLRITPLHPSLGAEVAGVDLSRPLHEPMRHELNRALAEHLALVFRNQSLTPEQYLAASAIFGPPMEQHYSQHNMANFPADRAHLAPERSASGRAVAHRPHEPRASARRHHPVRCGDSVGGWRHQRGQHGDHVQSVVVNVRDINRRENDRQHRCDQEIEPQLERLSG